VARRPSGLKLVALWDRAVGGEHEVLAFVSTGDAKRHLQHKEGDNRAMNKVKAAVASQAVVVRHSRRDCTQPAVEAPGVLSSLDVAFNELPPVNSEKALPPHKFKRLLPHALKERVAAWEIEVRTALSEQLIQQLSDVASAEFSRTHEPASPNGVGLTHDEARSGPPTYEEVLRQPLHGNVHLKPGSDWSGRLTPAAEDRASRWARAGIKHVVHLLIRTERDAPFRLMTPDEFVDCYDDVACAEYSSLVDDALLSPTAHR